MRAKITFSKKSLYYKNGEITRTEDNLSEVHYNYDNGERVAFESNGRGTGCTIDIKDIEEIEIKE